MPEVTMARHGLWVVQGSLGKVTPQDARLANAGLLSGVPGAMAGYGNITGSTSGPNMKYIVPAGVIVTVRQALATDGVYINPVDASTTIDSGAPAPGSGSRWDVIYALAKNTNDGAGDATSDFVLGVAVGTPSATPSVPAIPAGAVELARSNVGTAIANASLATITQSAAAVVARGGVMPCTSTTRPTSGLYVGFLIYETDTGLIKVCTALTPSVAWTTIADPAAASAWTSYTPVWTGSGGGGVSLGTGGSLQGSYKQVGKTVHYRISMLLGTGASGPAGDYQWSLPVTAARPFSTRTPAGTAIFFGGAYITGTVLLGGTDGNIVKCFFGTTAGAGAQAAAQTGTPGVWQSGSQIVISGTYEAS